MEKNRKLFLICLAVVFIAFTATAAMAERSLIVGNTSVCNFEGQTATLDITLSGEFNVVNGLAFTLTYDPDIFEFVGLVESGQAIDDGVDYEPDDPPEPSEVETTLYYQANDISEEGRVLIAAASAKFFTEDTENFIPFRVQFKVKEGQSFGSYDIGVEQTIIGPDTALNAGYTEDTPVSVATGLDPDDDPTLAASYDDVDLVAGSIETLDCIYDMGDVDGSGNILLNDVKLAFSFFMGAQSTPAEFNAANVYDDGDGNTTISLHDVKGVFTLFMGGSLDS